MGTLELSKCTALSFVTVIHQALLRKLRHFFVAGIEGFNAESGDSNIELAHHLLEHTESSDLFGAHEIAEALVLAIVAGGNA
jgi:hypothetical protein